MVVSILQNWSKKYFSHNSNIKCVDSTIKCIGFASFHKTINLDDVSSFMVFNDIDYIVCCIIEVKNIIIIIVISNV